MSTYQTFGSQLRNHGISRRSFLKFCTAMSSLLALPPAMIPRMVHALENSPRQSVIWLSFQECTGCTESFLRAHTSSVEELIFDLLSLDYHHTLQAAAGEAAENALAIARQTHAGNYILIVEGAIPLANPGYSTIAGTSNLDTLTQLARDAKAIIAVGTCASFGGIPHAAPNPTGAVSVEEIITDKPLVNISGCPPVPVLITGVIVHLLTFGQLPELDRFKRPATFFGSTVHKGCYRRPFFNDGQFAESFDDDGAKQGWCLFKLGCKGIVTNNACATVKWNQETSFPIQSGHGCLGCAEPHFWDNGSFYQSLYASVAKALPNLGGGQAVDKNGQPLLTQTTFAGGIAIAEGEGNFHQVLTVRLTNEVNIQGSVTVTPAHQNQVADILVFAAYKPLLASLDSPPLYFMLDSTGNILPWNEVPATLVPFQQVTLNAVTEVKMYQGLFIATGSLKVSFGYRLPDGVVVTNSKTIDITITE